MSFCQIHHMDIVADTGSVRRIVIVAEYTDLLQLADCYLCDIRGQVIRDTCRILTDHTALMGAYRVKVA